MRLWRVVIGLLLLVVLALPVAMPFVELATQWRGWQAWLEVGRLRQLAGNTLALLAGTLALSLPAGVAGAVLLYRTDLPLRGLLRFFMLLALFIPLPLFAAAWQATLGSTGWLPLPAWRTPEIGAPWAQGLTAAVWVHALAALPWVVFLVGQGLLWIERELEEDALTVLPPWRVLLQITLPRCRVVVGAAALWVTLQTATEITVTDLMKVRTFAEEVYTQFVGPETDAQAPGAREVLARAVAVSLPAFLAAWALAGWTVARWERDLPPLQTLARPPVCFSLRRWRWPCFLLVFAAVVVMTGVPVASLVRKAGLSGEPQAWSWLVMQRALANVLHVRGVLIGESLAWAAVAGMLTAGLGLIVCWLALGTRFFRAFVIFLIAAAWALPGPIVGLGLKATIQLLIDLVPLPALAQALYYGPSPVPLLWAYVLRFFPYAVAALWPVVRLMPQELRDMVRLDGLGPLGELRHLFLPLTRPALIRAAIAVEILSLGELSAGKLAETPGSQTFAHEVFMQMHYGVGNDLAALCLILLAVVLAGSLLLAATQHWGRRKELGGPWPRD